MVGTRLGKPLRLQFGDYFVSSTMAIALTY
jgi:hypothetical protein